MTPGSMSKNMNFFQKTQYLHSIKAVKMAIFLFEQFIKLNFSLFRTLVVKVAFSVFQEMVGLLKATLQVLNF
jgi:hypothetical protein